MPRHADFLPGTRHCEGGFLGSPQFQPKPHTGREPVEWFMERGWGESGAHEPTLHAAQSKIVV